jgi:hypothetical protein
LVILQNKKEAAVFSLTHVFIPGKFTVVFKSLKQGIFALL